MDKNCVFCKIIGNEIPSSTLYEDENFMAIMDISPANKGHVIILSKSHIKDVFELDENSAKNAMVVVKKLANAIKKELGCDGLNVLQNNGVAAGQTVFHYHIHLIPRFNDDTVKIEWINKSYGEGEAKLLCDAIKKHII